jgi:predicted component of type VI protein secretion system
MRTFSKLMLVAALVAACSSLASAQSKKNKEDLTVRTIQGTVSDAADKPVNGAVVQLKDMRTLQVRSFITQDQGEYHFSGLKVDTDYQVKAEFSGTSSDAKTLSVFDNRRAPSINLKLEKK